MLSRRVIVILTCAGAAAGLGWWRVQADGDTSTPAASAAVQSGVTAYVDESGNLIEPPAGAAKQAAAGSRDFARFTYEPTPSGGVALNFNGAWQSSAVAHVGGDGQIAVQCVPGDGEVNGHEH